MKNKTKNVGSCFCWQKKGRSQCDEGVALFPKNSLVFILASLICLAGILYIFQINKTATMGYEIKEKEDVIQELREKNKQLEIQAAQLRSIYISQIQEEQKNKEVAGEKKEMEESSEKEQDTSGNEEEESAGGSSILSLMKKPAQITFIEVEIERSIAMR